MITEFHGPIGSFYGKSLIVGLARVFGVTVGVITQNCKYTGGCFTALACQKLIRFIELTNIFNIPIITHLL